MKRIPLMVLAVLASVFSAVSGRGEAVLPVGQIVPYPEVQLAFARCRDGEFHPVAGGDRHLGVAVGQ